MRELAAVVVAARDVRVVKTARARWRDAVACRVPATAENLGAGVAAAVAVVVRREPVGDDGTAGVTAPSVVEPDDGGFVLAIIVSADGVFPTAGVLIEL